MKLQMEPPVKPVYLDYASATPLEPRVLKAMLPFFTGNFANPGSLHAAGREAREAVEDSRKKVAGILHCRPDEILFTSGGTESINLAIQGLALARKKGHIITSVIEHPSVLETCRHLESKGFQVTYLGVDGYGMVSPAQVQKALRKDTILISIQYANNEIGTIQPIREIGILAGKHGIPLHTDACQAGMLTLNAKFLGVGFLTLNGSKLYAPKGSGILYKSSALSPVLKIEPLLHGGGQEFGLRSGTENLPGIVGFARALSLVQADAAAEIQRLFSLRQHFLREIFRLIPEVVVNGSPGFLSFKDLRPANLSGQISGHKSLPNIINLGFAGIEADEALLHLSRRGIYVSAGSACASRQVKVSHVLEAIAATFPRGSLRFSLGRSTTRQELTLTARHLAEIIASLRAVKVVK